MDADALEAAFPTKAAEAFARARAAALDAGLTVLEAENGILYRVWLDGRRVPVKALALPTKVTIGKTYRLR